MGYSDLGCMGGEIQTPNLDALAANGACFTQFYNTARCCPTRASLLTGLHPHAAGMGHMGDNTGLPGYTGSIHNRCVTIAEVLKPAGYRTYAVGKWHVTHPYGPKGPFTHYPLQRGFDKFYGTITGAGSYYDPTTLCRGNTFITPENDPDYQPASFYYTDALTDNAIRFLQQHRTESGDPPFFMYLAYTAAHWPTGMKGTTKGRLISEPGQLPDILATCADLAGAQYPKFFKGNEIVPMAGKSLKPMLVSDTGKLEDRMLFWEHEGNRAVRDGHWKLVAKGPAAAWELYDMSKDRTELNDLADEHPDRVKTMAKAWENWAYANNVLPWPWKPPYTSM